MGCMTEDRDPRTLSRRAVLGAAGAGAAGAALFPGTALADPGVTLWRQPGPAGAPDVHGVHLQFGADASREVVVSWSTPESVGRPRGLFGRARGAVGPFRPGRVRRPPAPPCSPARPWPIPA